MAESIKAARQYNKDRKAAGISRKQGRHINTYGGSFDQAFAQARANGEDQFIWSGDGKPYTTNVLDWNSGVKSQVEYANYKERRLGKKRYAPAQNRFQVVGQFNPQTGNTRYLIKDTSDDLTDIEREQLGYSEPTFGISGRFIGDMSNGGGYLTFNSPEEAKAYMKTEDFARNAGTMEVSAPRRKVSNKTKGLVPINRPDVMGDKGLRNGDTRIYQDTRTGMYFISDVNGDIIGYTTDPNAVNEGWGTTPGNGGWIPTSSEAGQEYRMRYGDYASNLIKASDAAGESPYTRPDIYTHDLYNNPVAQDTAAARNDFSRGAVNYFNSIIRLPWMLGETAISRAPGLGLPTYNFWEHIGSNFDNTDAPGAGDFLADAFAPNNPLNGYGRAALNFAGDVLTTGGFASFVPESGITYTKLASTKNLPGVARFEYNPAGPTIKLENEAGQVLMPTRNGSWDLGKDVPAGINSGYAFARVTNDRTPYIVRNPSLGVSGMTLFDENAPGYFEWVPRQYQQSLWDYSGGGTPSSIFVTGRTPEWRGGNTAAPTGQVYPAQVRMRSVTIPTETSGETVLPVVGVAPDNISIPDTQHNMMPIVVSQKHGGRLGFPIFKNGGIVKGQNNLDTEDVDPRVAQARANNERERGIASQYFHSTPTIGNLIRAGYHYWKSDPMLGGESENPDMLTGIAPSAGPARNFNGFVKSATNGELVQKITSAIKNGNFNSAQNLLREAGYRRILSSGVRQQLWKDLKEGIKATKESLR